MSTMKDDAEYATKPDIRRLDQTVTRIAAGLTKTQAEVREIKQTMATKQDISRILGSIDAFAAKMEIYAREGTLFPFILDTHGQTLKNHERRIRALESR